MLRNGDLTRGGITGTLLRFTLPMMAGSLLQQCYNIADTLIVGQCIGADALAAVGSAYTLMVFLISILLGLSIGSGTVFSLHYGAGNHSALRRSIFVSFVLIGAVTCVLNMAVFVWLDPILRLLQVPQDIYGMDVVQACNGLEVQIELSSRRFMGLKERRRALAGRTGCGVCGVEQLNDIGKPVAPLPFTQTFNLANLDHALAHLNDVQPIGQLSGCTHAAAWVLPSGEIAGGHEDVGRHVALDKLMGRRARESDLWQQGAALVSSRASYEMVQKSAMCGVEILFAVSAATTLAVEVAERCNLTLVGFCKPGRATVYTHPQRLIVDQ